MKLFNKQRIITRCLRGMLAVIILSAMLSGGMRRGYREP